MKIAVASDDSISLTGHVGRCEMFLVFAVDGKNIIGVEQRQNSFTMHKQSHGHNENEGRHSHEGIVAGLSDCRYLICSSAGPGLIADLASMGITTLLTEENTAETAVLQFLEGSLRVDESRTCKGHNH